MKYPTLYNSCARVRVRVRRRKKLKKNRGKQLQSLKLRMEYGKRNGIFTRTKRNFLRFRYRKPTVPQRKTYGSNGGNIRFAKGKHKNNENVTRFSTRGLQKNWLQMKKLIRFFRQEQENTPSRKGIKKGVPLNSNLC